MSNARPPVAARTTQRHPRAGSTGLRPAAVVGGAILLWQAWVAWGQPFPAPTCPPCVAFPALAGVAAAAPAIAHRPQDTAASTDELALLRANQVVFHAVAEQTRRYLVRIDTVGGSQPPQRLAEAEPGEGDDSDAPPEPRSQNPFRDAPGSSFTVADGPTTGIIYSDDGFIVTSSFNFVRDPQLINVTLPDGRRLAADLVARDQVRKIALLKIDAVGLDVPTWAARDEIAVGQWAIALGLGFGGERPAVSLGIVSALGRMLGNAVQSDAKISPANYGGPLVDVDGRIVGLCVPMAQRPGELAGIELYDSGVGFAVPGWRVDEIVAELKRGVNFYRGWLGINVNVRRQDGVYIENIADPSPLRSAGGLPGDRIIEAAGHTVEHFGHLVQALNMRPAGEIVHLVLQRDDETIELDVTLARSLDLGPLPDLAEPFDPSSPTPPPHGG